LFSNAFQYHVAQWPDYFYVAENNNKSLMGYVMGKAEGDGGMIGSIRAQ
jgi:hypothetical protein